MVGDEETGKSPEDLRIFFQFTLGAEIVPFLCPRRKKLCQLLTINAK